MFVFGAVLVLEGILDIVLPTERAAGLGLEECSSQAQLVMAVLGVSWMLAGAGILLTARDPLRHLSWVRFALSFPLALLLALAGTVIVGDVGFETVAVDIAVNLLFVALFLAFYPWKKAGRRDVL